MTSRSIALLALALALAAPAPGAQEDVAPTRDVVRPPAGFAGRDREFMHPGNPLEVVGLEDADNDIRSRTPALERSDRQAAVVDLEELYDRKLALYEGRVFAKPLDRRDSTRHRDRGFEADRERVLPTADEAPADIADPSGIPWLAMVAAAAFAGSLAAIFRHRLNTSAMARRAN